MNILYLTDSDITINKGGVNRVTHFLSRKFMQIPGWKCYLAYLFESTVLPVSDFDGKIKLNKTDLEIQLKNFIIENNIHIVIINLTVKKNIFEVLPDLKKISSQLPSLHSIFCFHTFPGYELIGIKFKEGILRLLHSPEKLKTLQWLILNCLNNTPLKSLLLKHIAPKYRFIYDHCDKLILLSPYYIPSFAQYANIKISERIGSITNPLSFEKGLPVEDLIHKQKEVLIVARLSERPKRLSLALKIWKQVELSKQSNDWKLVIVGNGEDENYYHKLAEKLELRNISFEGRQSPIEYYKRASVFMMTSLFEGWGLTLVEAQQMGCIPVATNSYDAIHDILQNNYNGIIVPDNNIEEFTQKLLWLMAHAEERKQLALNGLESCQQFSMEKVVAQWCQLFEKLQSDTHSK